MITFFGRHIDYAHNEIASWERHARPFGPAPHGYTSVFTIGSREFSMAPGASLAVTDDFGNLVQVPYLT